MLQTVPPACFTSFGLLLNLLHDAFPEFGLLVSPWLLFNPGGVPGDTAPFRVACPLLRACGIIET